MDAMYGRHARPPEDLTARARIVDAALAQFAAHGSSHTTLRAIADAAGVSVGLVQHHFGTKRGLRAACDERVLALVRMKIAQAHPGGQITSPDFISTLYDAALPVMPYVARAALERDAEAAVLFDAVAALTAEFLTSQWPERFPTDAERTRDAAATLLAMSMGTAVLHHQLVRQMGLDPHEPIPSPRIVLATLDVYQSLGEWLGSAFGADLRQAVDTISDHAATRTGTP